MNDEGGAAGWRRRNRVQSLQAVRALADYLSVIGWEAFMTLTVDPKRRFPVDERLANREGFWWCTNVGKLARRDVAWLYVTERGRGGAWHTHALLIGIGAVDWTTLAAVWEMRNGRIDVQSVMADLPRLVNYLAKASDPVPEPVFSDNLTRFFPHPS